LSLRRVRRVQEYAGYESRRTGTGDNGLFAVLPDSFLIAKFGP